MAKSKTATEMLVQLVQESIYDVRPSTGDAAERLVKELEDEILTMAREEMTEADIRRMSAMAAICSIVELLKCE